MQVSDRGRNAGVSQKALDDRDLHTRLQQVRRKGMAQAVNTALVRQPSSLDGVPENLGRRAIEHRLLRMTGRREKPNPRPAEFPIRAQLLQQPRGEQRVTILAPFALL